MKSKRKLCIKLLCICIFTTFHVIAQLTGTVTINSAAPNSLNNYQSFTSLAAKLGSVGLSGPLTVNVIPGSGPYVEQVVFFPFTGASPINTITINGNQNLITFTNSTQGGGLASTMLLMGADYMFFNNLNIRAVGVYNYAVGCHLSNGANFNSFSFCTFSCVANINTFGEIALAISSSTSSANAPSTGDAGSFNKFDNCTMFSGAYAAYLSGKPNKPYNSGNTFTNCRMTDWLYYGIYADYQENLWVRGCHIDRPTRTQFAVGYGLGFAHDPGGLWCERNCIENLSGGFPNTTGHIHGIHYDASTMPPGSVKSNINTNYITNIVTNGASYGMEIIGLNGACNTNTVDLNNGSGTNGLCYAFYGQPGNKASDSMHVVNNYFALNHQGGGQKYCAYFTSMVNCRINNNRYFIASGNPGTNSIGFFNATLSTFTLWQSQGMDINGLTYGFDPNAKKLSYCSNTTELYTTIMETSSVGDELLKIYPNPSTGELYIESKYEGNIHFNIVDISGRSMFSASSTDTKIKVDITLFPSGIYFIKTREGDKITMNKLIKE